MIPLRSPVLFRLYFGFGLGFGLAEVENLHITINKHQANNSELIAKALSTGS